MSYPHVDVKSCLVADFSKSDDPSPAMLGVMKTEGHPATFNVNGITAFFLLSYASLVRNCYDNRDNILAAVHIDCPNSISPAFYSHIPLLPTCISSTRRKCSSSLIRNELEILVAWKPKVSAILHSLPFPSWPLPCRAICRNDMARL